MKWIGQHIWSFISRFRNDVYLEDVSSGTIASGGNLGLDSNNKIVKATITSSSGDIEGVTAGTGLSGGGTSGTVTLNVSGLTISELAGASLTTSSESFADNDTTLMTSAAINDRIESFGYTTNTGDITGVAAGTNLSGGGNSGDVTINLADASTSAKGAALFDAEDFAVSSGTVTIKSEGVDLTSQVTGVLPSANLDADTAHYSAIRQATYNYFKVDLSSKVFIGLQEADAEHSSETNKNLPILAPVSGKLLKVFLRTGGNVSAKTLTITLEHLTTSNNTSTANVAVVGTQSGSGPTASSMVTYDFTTGLDSGTNTFSAGDMLYLGFASSASTGNILFYVTSLWEWDYS